MTPEIVELTTPTPPTGTTFAAVQVEASRDGESWRIVGAEPTRRVIRDEDGRVIREELLPQIAARCKLTPQDTLIRCLWVCEDSSRGTIPEGPLPIPAHGDPHAGAATYGGGR